MSIIHFKPCLNLLEPNLALQTHQVHKAKHQAAPLAVLQSRELFHTSTLDTNPACRFHYAERLYFEPNLQSTGEKTWGGCSRRAQEMEQLRQYKTEIPEVGNEKAG